MKAKKIFLIFILILIKLIHAEGNVDTITLWEKPIKESRYSHYSKSNEIINIKLEEISSILNNYPDSLSKATLYEKTSLEFELNTIKYLLYRTKAINSYNLGNYKESYEAINKCVNLENSDVNEVLIFLKFLTENKMKIKDNNHSKLKNSLLSYNLVKTGSDRFFYFLLSRYFLFNGDIEKSLTTIKKAMQHYGAHNLRNNIIVKEVYLLYDFLQYLQGENISNTELENLSKIDDYFSETTNVNYYYFKSIISFDKGDIKMAKSEFKKAEDLINEKKMEYNYKMDNLYNIFTKKYRDKLQKIEKLTKR